MVKIVGLLHGTWCAEVASSSTSTVSFSVSDPSAVVESVDPIAYAVAARCHRLQGVLS